MPTGAAIGAIGIGPGATESKKRTFRPDIQGLRMVAVVAVILDHLLHWPAGGFVGVDVFFVISGFLITGLLIREHEKTGTISFSGFYRRRLKRIAPAATVVIIVAVVVAFQIFARPRAVATLWDGIWAFTFAANWNMATQGTDYFQLGGPVSPLQHYWSLAVEEQFYLVWPWLMLFVFAVVGKVSADRPARARLAAGVTMLGIIVVSFSWSIIETVSAPTWAYFSTFSRAWELGVGALLAIFAGVAARIPGWVRPIVGWAGLVAIIVSLFVVPATSGFPAPWAALPVLGTALVIAAGTGGQQRLMWPLTNPVSGYVGNLSYSMYLWHFPFIVFAISLFGDGTTAYFLFAVPGMLICSVLGYHFLEDPIRRSSWLEPRGSQARTTSKRRWRSLVRRRRPALVGVGMTALTVGVVVLSIMALSPPAPPVSATERATPTPSTTLEAVDSQEAVDIRRAQLTEALAAAAWPELTPTINDLSDNGRSLLTPEWVTDGCLSMDHAREKDPIANAQACTYGPANASNTAVLYGDSIAISYAAGIRAALPGDWRLRVFTMATCPASDVPARDASGGPYSECADLRDWVETQVDGAQLLIISQAIDSQRLASGATGDEAIDEYAEGMEKTIARLAPRVGQVKLISRPPVGVAAAECWTPVSSPVDCVSDVANSDSKMSARYSRMAGGNVEYVDSTDWFCVKGKCPAFAGGVLLRADNAHLTAAGSSALGPLLAESLFPPATNAE